MKVSGNTHKASFKEFQRYSVIYSAMRASYSKPVWKDTEIVRIQNIRRKSENAGWPVPVHLQGNLSLYLCRPPREHIWEHQKGFNEIGILQTERGLFSIIERRSEEN